MPIRFSMPKRDPRRKRRFEKAIRSAGHTMQSWAEAQGVTYTHLYYVLRGDRSSERLEREIEQAIAADEAAANAA